MVVHDGLVTNLVLVSQGGGGGGGGGKREVVDRDWSREQVQLLVKAVALYPAGTIKR